jgi:DedD protein
VDQNTKQRLVGITVVFALAVIFLPMILDGSGVRENTLEPQFVDENSSTSENQVEQETAKANLKDSTAKKNQFASNTKTQPEVEVALVGGDTWVLQVGSFKDHKKALSQRDKLRKSHIAAVFVEQFKIGNEPIYRVRLGPFLNRDQSKIALNKVKAKHDIDGLIMKYNK